MAATTMVVVAMIVVPAGLTVGLLRGDRLVPTDAATWAGLAYLGAITMAIAYVLLFAGLRTLPSASATLLESVTAVVIAVLLLGERLTLAGLLGSVLIVAAIASLGLGPPASQVGHATRLDRPTGDKSEAPEPDGHGSHPHPPCV